STFDEKTMRISFLDTGPGIPEENLQKIFEPLFTTKKRGEGTGLGLSICYEIIKKHRGDIFVASDQRKGTCFVIELPIRKSAS
ncbi:MAG: HAMP domain-containing sensor histidine kinase, partial [Thermodesulfobacteriota bacterium]|nr:HAMP domain-containing sensor histidine kinase [Thermodesulfobacteriota bacterium]